MAPQTPIPTRLRPFVTPANSSHDQAEGTTNFSAHLSCPTCAGMAFTLFGFPDKIRHGAEAGETFFFDPISVHCKRCGHSAVLFDYEDGDGYNAVLEKKKRPTPAGEPQAWRLNGAEEVYQVRVDVSYAEDTYADPVEGERYDDMFDGITFSCVGGDGKAHQVNWFETA